MFRLSGFAIVDDIEERYRPLFEEERRQTLVKVIEVTAKYISIPLFMLLWICDLFYLPQFKWYTLAIRLGIVPVDLISMWLARRCKTSNAAENVVFLYLGINALFVLLITTLSNDPNSPYYAGLNLVAIAGLAFVPWKSSKTFPVVIASFFPYLVWLVWKSIEFDQYVYPVIHFFLLTCTVVTSVIVLKFNTNLRVKEFLARIKLDEQSDMLERALEKMSEQASQVAHDIRSPLLALNVAMGDPEVKALPNSSQKLITASAKRIREIAENLLYKYRTGATENLRDGMKDNAPSVSLLAGLIDSIVWEKRVQHRTNSRVKMTWEITHNSFSIFSKIQPSDFKRAMANLIENAFESIEGKGEIEVHLEKERTIARITIRDSGRGIPAEWLEKIGAKGLSIGKENLQGSGHGLGIYQAKTAIQSWGGTLSFESKEGMGTKVTIELPLESKPSWICNQFPQIDQFPTILCLDDDPSFHKLLKNKFSQLGRINNAIFLSQISDTEKWMERSPDKVNHTFFFIDYQLGRSQVSGLEFILKHSLQKRSILLSSLLDDEDVFKKCSEAGISFMPKKLLEGV